MLVLRRYKVRWRFWRRSNETPPSVAPPEVCPNIPRCEHGHIILGCPHDDCAEQNAYLEAQRRAVDEWYARTLFPPKRVRIIDITEC